MLRRVEDFRHALHELFHSGDAPQDVRRALEAETVLNSLDYFCLLQAVRHSARKVFEYQASGNRSPRFAYRGPELFLTDATKLYEDKKQIACGTATRTLAYELWYLPDNSFAVTTCFRVDVEGGAYVTEYRVNKGCDWTDTGMDIDFYLLALWLREMSRPVLENEYPIYDL